MKEFNFVTVRTNGDNLQGKRAQFFFSAIPYILLYCTCTTPNLSSCTNFTLGQFENLNNWKNIQIQISFILLPLPVVVIRCHFSCVEFKASRSLNGISSRSNNNNNNNNVFIS